MSYLYVKKQLFFYYGDKGLDDEFTLIWVFSLFTFFLDKKSNKKIKTVRSGIFRSWEISPDEPSPDAQDVARTLNR